MTKSNTLETGFDVDNEEGFSLLPKGKYKAEITDATVGPTNNRKGQLVTLTWTITEGEYENRLLFQRILIQHESEEAQRFGRMKFKDVCAACGITGVVTDLDPLCYKTCVIAVVIRKDEEGHYDDQNEVSKVSPLASFNGDRDRLKKPREELLKEASATPKAFEASKKDMDDEIPF